MWSPTASDPNFMPTKAETTGTHPLSYCPDPMKADAKSTSATDDAMESKFMASVTVTFRLLLTRFSV